MWKMLKIEEAMVVFVIQCWLNDNVQKRSEPLIRFLRLWVLPFWGVGRATLQMKRHVWSARLGEHFTPSTSPRGKNRWNININDVGNFLSNEWSLTIPHYRGLNRQITSISHHLTSAWFAGWRVKRFTTFSSWSLQGCLGRNWMFARGHHSSFKACTVYSFEEPEQTFNFPFQFCFSYIRI